MEQTIKTIINHYTDLFSNDFAVRKINVGFTNSVYSIDDKYIIKICSNVNNEDSFRNEIEFYKKNKDNNLIPKLFYSDDTKKIVPYLYEIIEKIEGVSLYNVWHILKENERKNIIKQLCEAMKIIHSNIGESYDWTNYIKSNFIRLYNIAKEKKIFNSEEQILIEKSIKLFDKLLESNDFVLVHNDLHFDNIFYNNGKIKLIDFERSMFAPRDFELDIFYRMIRMPWKFASEETEDFTKIEEYSNIMNYLNEFYPKLTNIPNLYERLAIYDMIYFIKDYVEHPELEELKIPIIEGAKLLITRE